MQLKFPFNSSSPIFGEATVSIDKKIDHVFHYVGERFFDNYPKWAVEVIHFEPLEDNKHVFIGAKAKQIRKDNGTKIESVFEITDYEPHTRFGFQGINAPYKHTYLFENNENNESTTFTFRFELLELDIFMRSFQKLIRVAIEDGAENVAENIKNLVVAECH
ncbi:MAG: SRPBCC family protein [Methylococcaceae bacterium]